VTLPDLNRLARMEGLRQVPSHPPAVERAVAAAEAALTSARAERDDAAIRRLLGYLGKVLLDCGDVPGAEACLERALGLRRALGDPELLASTEQALAAAREMGRWT
jgi:hypothetical protein